MLSTFIGGLQDFHCSRVFMYIFLKFVYLVYYILSVCEQKSLLKSDQFVQFSAALSDFRR